MYGKKLDDILCFIPIPLFEGKIHRGGGEIQVSQAGTTRNMNVTFYSVNLTGEGLRFFMRGKVSAHKKRSPPVILTE